MKILIFGLPGSGKTTLAMYLLQLLGENTMWFNADEVRKAHNDWDFSDEGRLRQATRMRDSMEAADEEGFSVIVDFVCPTDDYRNLFGTEVFKIWVDTIKESEYEDTNKVFQSGRVGTSHVNYVVEEQRGDVDARHIMWQLCGVNFNPKNATTQLLGRFQPWHDGHQALFERALSKTGQVLIMVRDMDTDENNPFTASEVVENLKLELAEYAGIVKLAVVPNIMHITYGRKVGYVIEQEHFDEDIESISATEIRKTL